MATRHQKRKSSAAVDTTISVSVRVRPYVPASDNVSLADPLVAANKPAFEIEDDGKSIIDWVSKGTSANQSFSFDDVFKPGQTTQEIYESAYRERIMAAMKGYNATIFAYGQTGGGKTFTMTGKQENPGIIPLAIHDIFQYIQDHPASEYMIRLGYVEIYNERVRDLLHKKMPSVDILNGPKGEVIFRNLQEHQVTSEEQVLDLLKKGQSFRTVAQNYLHEASSRSHSVLRLVIEGREKKGSGGVHVASLTMIDLAGAETAYENAETDRRREGKNINLSLLYLKEVITALSKKKVPTSLRNSKLTRILAPSLDGNAFVAIICNVAPTKEYLQATRKTLEFGCIAKKVAIRPTQNTTYENTLLHAYEEEIKSLQEQLALQAQASVSVQNTEEMERLKKDLEESLADRQNAIITSETMAEKLKTAESQAEMKAEEVVQLAKEIEEMKSRLEQEEAEKSGLDAKAKEKEKMVESLSKERAQLEARLIATKEEIERAEKDSQAQSDMLSRMESEQQAMSSKLAEQEEAREQAIKLAEQKQEELAMMRERHDDLESKWKQEEEARAVAEANAASSEHALSQLSVDNSRLEEAFRDEEGKRKMAEDEAKLKEALLLSLQDQNDELKSKCREQEDATAQAHQVALEREKTLHTLKEDKAQLEESYRLESSRRAEAESKAKEQQEEVHTLKMEHDTLNNQFKDEVAKRVEAEDAAKKNRVALAALETKQVEMKQKFEKEEIARKVAEEVAAAQEGKLNSIRRRNDELQRLYGSEEIKRKEAEQAASIKERELKMMQSRNSTLEQKFKETEALRQKAEDEARQRVNELASLTGMNSQLKETLSNVEASKLKLESESADHSALMGVINQIIGEDHHEFTKQIETKNREINELGDLLARKEALLHVLVKKHKYSDDDLKQLEVNAREGSLPPTEHSTPGTSSSPQSFASASSSFPSQALSPEFLSSSSFLSPQPNTQQPSSQTQDRQLQSRLVTLEMQLDEYRVTIEKLSKILQDWGLAEQANKAGIRL